MNKSEDVLLAALGYPKKRIGMSAEAAGAVPAGQPALDHFELLGDAGVIREKHQAPLTTGGVVESRPVRHPSAHDAWDASVARIRPADVGMQRAAAAIIIFIGEGICRELLRAVVRVHRRRVTIQFAAGEFGQYVAAGPAEVGVLAEEVVENV